jgi:hypothetical protein
MRPARSATWGALLGLAILLAAACGGDDKVEIARAPTLTPLPSPRESAEDAIRRHFDLLDTGQWARYYAELHPAQQAIVPREDFEFCLNQSSGRLGSLRVVTVLETYPDERQIEGTSVRSPSTALTVEYEVGAGDRQSTARDTFHEYPVDGQWRWASANPERLKRPCA